MKHFEHYSATDTKGAVEFLQANQNTRVIAGGTDLLSCLKHQLETEYPTALLDIKAIDGLTEVFEDAGVLHLGAAAKLADLSQSALVQELCAPLSEAARSVATPLVRNLATLGGNLCQDVRCWYYRYPNELGGRINCLRKGGELCNAITGDNRNHSIFGGKKVEHSSCTQHCPAHVDIPEYLACLRAGDVEGAASILMEANPMPAITSRVCTHFCQMNCKRKEYDERVNVGSMERFVGDYILDNADRYMQAPATESGKKVAVVGAGPAGLTAAYYLRRRGHQVLVIDKMEEVGGLLRYAIPEYRLPKEIVRRFAAALEKMGIRFRMNTEVGKDILLADLVSEYDSVFLNTGAWKRPLIGLEGEELTTFGLDFLVEVNRWMSGKVGKDIIVVGGGNVAVDVAITAKRLGAANVVMACLEEEDKMPASEEEIARAREEGVVIMPSWGPMEILRTGDTITGLKLKRCSSVLDDKGHFAPVYDESETTVLEGRSILMAVGQKTDLSFLGERMSLEVNRGLIAVDADTMKTSLPNVFAVGDVTTGPKTVVAAIADGKKATVAVEAFLMGTPPPDSRFPLGRRVVVEPASLVHSASLTVPERPAQERRLDLEDSFGVAFEQVQQEANRCFNCSCMAVNPSDVATVLVALDATVVTSNRSIKLADLLEQSGKRLLPEDELLLEVLVPLPKGCKLGYDKYRVRESHDFAVVSVASSYRLQGDKVAAASIVLGAVAHMPLHARKAEEYLVGKAITEATANEAAELALEGATPLSHNDYKLQIAKTLVRNSLLAAK